MKRKPKKSTQKILVQKRQRKKIPSKIEKEILIRSRRRCPLCVYLKNDLNIKKIQINHLDKNPNNNDIDNLVAFCLEHHDEYHQKSGLTKGLKLDEIKHYRDMLYENIEEVLQKYKEDLVKNHQEDDSNWVFEKYRNLKEPNAIEKKKDILIGNLIKIQGFEKIWRANSTCNTYLEVRDRVNYPPPFSLYENWLISLLPFNDKNPLKEIILLESVEPIIIEAWKKEDNLRNILIQILNTSIIKYCQLRGLYYDKEHNRWYYPEKTGEKSIPMKWVKNGNVNERYIVKCQKKEEEINFFFHYAFSMKTVYIENKFYYFIIPEKVFTIDGINLVESDQYRNLEEKYRKSIMGYNPNQLNDVFFWKYFLFEDPQIFCVPLIQSEKEKAIQKETQKILKIINPSSLSRLLMNKRPKPKEKPAEKIFKLKH